MSFNTEFYAANSADAMLIAEQDPSLPPPVRAFLFCALAVLDEKTPVYVKAVGHLCDSPSSYVFSVADIRVTPIGFRKPKEENGNAFVSCAQS